MSTLSPAVALESARFPSDWVVKPLMYACTENRTKNAGLTESNVLSLSYGRIKTRDVESNFGLLPESFETYQIVEPGMVVLRLTDLQNDQRSLRTGLVTERGIITSAYLALRTSGSHDARFFHFLLHAYDIAKVFYMFGGGVRQSMKFDDLKRVPIVYPPLPVQRAIADFLDRKTAVIDELIRKKERLIELLQEKRQALITQAVTKGLDPNVPMKDSGIQWLREIPAHWEVKRLKHISPKQHGRLIVSPNKYIEDDGIPIVFGFNIRDGKVDLATIRYIGFQYEARFRNCTVAAGDLLCVRVGAPGETAVVPPELDGCHFASTMQIVQHSFFHSPWLAHAFNSHAVRHQISSVQYGAAQEQINVGDAVNFVIPTPPLDEQHAIASSLDAALARVSRIRNAIADQINRLREYRQTLISAAVTGQLPIPTDPAHAE